MAEEERIAIVRVDKAGEVQETLAISFVSYSEARLRFGAFRNSSIGAAAAKSGGALELRVNDVARMSTAPAPKKRGAAAPRPQKGAKKAKPPKARPATPAAAADAAAAKRAAPPSTGAPKKKARRGRRGACAEAKLKRPCGCPARSDRPHLARHRRACTAATRAAALAVPGFGWAAPPPRQATRPCGCGTGGGHKSTCTPDARVAAYAAAGLHYQPGGLNVCGNGDCGRPTGWKEADSTGKRALLKTRCGRCFCNSACALKHAATCPGGCLLMDGRETLVVARASAATSRGSAVSDRAVENGRLIDAAKAANPFGVTKLVGFEFAPEIVANWPAEVDGKDFEVVFDGSYTANACLRIPETGAVVRRDGTLSEDYAVVHLRNCTFKQRGCECGCGRRLGATTLEGPKREAVTWTASLCEWEGMKAGDKAHKKKNGKIKWSHVNSLAVGKDGRRFCRVYCCACARTKTLRERDAGARYGAAPVTVPADLTAEFAALARLRAAAPDLAADVDFLEASLRRR